jgi:S-adenosylmethionine:tRNA ribosyltransferase-isomerase
MAKQRNTRSKMTEKIQKHEDLILGNYDFDLPDGLIAQRPIPGRDSSKLLVYKVQTNEIIHDHFYNIEKYIPNNSTLVFNESKVGAYRILGHKKTGAKVEVIVLNPNETNPQNEYFVLIGSNSKKRIGDKLIFDSQIEAEISQIAGNGKFKIIFNKSLDIVTSEIGMIPIPPYIRGGLSDEQDTVDYQTTYAKNLGSVAAPTAGLHFSQDLLSNLISKGHSLSYVNLHVGIGTFAPVQANDLSDHKMHSEQYFIDDENLSLINNSKENNKLIAVGTTSLRVLESMNSDDFETNKLYDTDIFLYPGKDVQSISGLVTNFHLPKSTLLMLVSSLIGRKKCLELYEVAKENEYRFFSYGDGMLIIR